VVDVWCAPMVVRIDTSRGLRSAVLPYDAGSTAE
jgi:hypothetical protein